MRARAWILAACCLALAACVAQPREEPAVKLRLGERIQRRTLSNGLRVAVLEEHMLPLVTTLVTYGVGSVHEDAGRTGTSHFLEHMLFKGSRRFPKGSIDRFAYRAGGRVNAFTTEDATGFWFTVGPDAWRESLEIEADRMRHALLEEKEFAAEKQVVLEELARKLDEPWGKLWQELDRAAFDAHPYRNPVIGWEEDLKALTRGELARFYDRYYWPRNAVLTVVGDVRAADVFEAAQAVFGPIGQGGEALSRPAPEPPRRAEKSFSFDSGKEVTRVGLAFRTVPAGQPEESVLAVLADLLGHGKSSRLSKRLFEQEKLVGEGGVQVWNDTRRYDGLFYLLLEPVAGADPARAAEVALEELERSAREPASERELARARNAILAQFVFANEHTYDLATAISRGDLYGLPDYIDTYLERVQSVTAREVQKVARAFLRRERLTLATARGAGSGAAGAPARKPPSLYAASLAAGAPEAAADRLKLGPVHETRLANGLTLLVKPRPALPLAHVQLQLRKSGSVYDPPGKCGLAHFVGQMLDEGTDNPRASRKRTSQEIAESIEFVGGTLTTHGGGAVVQVLSKDLPLALDLLEDVILYPSWPEDRMETVRTSILEELRALADDPARLAEVELRKAVYAGHPLGRNPDGEPGEVRAVRRGDLDAFHKTFFHPENAVLVVSGDVDPGEVAEEVGARFEGPWPRRGPLALPQLPPAPLERGPGEAHVTQDTRQANVYLGHAGIARTDPDYEALRAMEFILMKGPGFTDRLSKAIRDEGGYAYAVFGDVTATAGEWPGLLKLYFGTLAANLPAVLQTARGTVEAFLAGGPTEGELEDSKNFLLRSFVFRWETLDGLSSYLADVHRFGLGLDYAAVYARRIQALTLEDIRRAARQHVVPQRFFQVVVGPRESAAAPREGESAG